MQKNCYVCVITYIDSYTLYSSEYDLITAGGSHSVPQ